MSIYSCLMLDKKLLLSGLYAYYFFVITSSVSAQEIIPDYTLPNPSQVTTEGDTLTIEGGTVAGSNLFHSLESFSVLQGQKAIFAGTPTTENIITRITGASPSQIDGLIRVAGNANLFLLNPNGIFFGKDAVLDIAGSFFASTANSWEFADGKIFSVATNQNNPLLTFSVPVGVQWGKNPAAKIENAGNLVVGKNLSLVAGNINSTGWMKTLDGKLVLTAQENLRLANGTNIANQVQIDAKSVELINTFILANTAKATTELRGDIGIRTDSLSVEDSFIQAITDNDDISASSNLGIDGVVDIQTLRIDPSQRDVELPSEFLDISQQVTQTCSVQARTNSFVIPGRSGLPLSPKEVLNNTPVWVDPRVKNRDEENLSQSNTLVEAVDWTIGSDGKVRLLGRKRPVGNKTQSCVDINS